MPVLVVPSKIKVSCRAINICTRVGLRLQKQILLIWNSFKVFFLLQRFGDLMLHRIPNRYSALVKWPYAKIQFSSFSWRWFNSRASLRRSVQTHLNHNNLNFNFRNQFNSFARHVIQLLVVYLSYLYAYTCTSIPDRGISIIFISSLYILCVLLCNI